MLTMPCPYCGWKMILTGNVWVHQSGYCHSATTRKRF